MSRSSRPRVSPRLGRVARAIDNCTPADMYCGRHHEVLSERDKIKKLTMQRRKKECRAATAA